MVEKKVPNYLKRDETPPKNPKRLNPKKHPASNSAYTHFVTFPFLQKKCVKKLKKFQEKIFQSLSTFERSCVIQQIPEAFHVTLCTLNLHSENNKKKACEVIKKSIKFIQETLENQEFQIELTNLKCFKEEKPWKKHENSQNLEQTEEIYNDLKIIYLDIEENQQLLQICDYLIREMIKEKVLIEQNINQMYMVLDQETKMFRPQNFHLTLFRVKKNEYLDEKKEEQVCDFKKIFENFGDHQMGAFSTHYIEISQFYQPMVRLSYLPQKNLLEDENLVKCIYD